MSFKDHQSAANKAAETILKNSDADAILIVAAKDEECLLVSHGNPKGLVGLVGVMPKVTDALLDKTMQNPKAALLLLQKIADAEGEES